MQMVVVNDKRFAVEERNGNISFNLTMMAKPFGKRPVDWLKSQSTVEYLRILSNVSGITFADLVQVREGAPHLGGGTWANDYRIAVRFAQWLDMGFAIAVDDLVYKLLSRLWWWSRRPVMLRSLELFGRLRILSAVSLRWLAFWGLERARLAKW